MSFVNKNRWLRYAADHRERLLSYAVLLLLGSNLWSILRFWHMAAPYPFQLNSGEGPVLLELTELALGGNIYVPGTEVFRATIYGPLYYLTGSLLWWSEPHSFFPMRAFSLTCIVLILILCFLVLHRATGNLRHAALFALFVPLSPVVHLWGIYMKPDTMAMLFSLLGLYLCLRFERRGFLYAAPVFALAFFTKQSFLAAPASVFLFLAFRDRVRAVQFAALLGVLVVLGVLFFEFVVFSEGEFFTHFILYNASTFGKGRYLAGAIAIFSTLLVFVLALAALLRPSFRENVFPTYLVVATVVAFVSIGKDESDINYYLEPWTAGCIVLGVASALRRKWLASVYAALLLLLLVSPYPRITAGMRVPDFIVQANEAAVRELDSKLQAGDLVASDSPGAVAAVGKPVVVLIDDPVVFDFMLTLRRDLVRPDLLAENADQGRLDLWISEQPVEHDRYRLWKRLPYYDGFLPITLHVYERANRRNQ